MAKRYPFEIQVVNRAFSGRVPEDMWRTVGHASHPVTALRRFQKEQRAVTPQPGSWSGHVRILCGGKPVSIEDHGETIRSVDWDNDGGAIVDWKQYA